MKSHNDSIPHSLSRRSMLQRTSLGIAGVLLAPRIQAAIPAGWKTAIGHNGFQSGSHRYQKTYPIWEVLNFASDQGFDGVELVSNWPQGSYPDAGETNRIEALRGLYDRYRLKIFSIQLGAGGAFSSDSNVRKSWIDSTRDRLKLASQLGCACVGMWPGGPIGDQSIDQAIRHVAASFHEVAAIGQDLGILTAFEIEPPFIFNTEEHLQRILSEADHPNLKTIYDPSHFDLMNGSTGRPHEMLKRIGVENIGYIHLTDTDGTLRNGGTSKHLPCGDGHANIPVSLKTLHEGGFQGWVMIDAWEIPDPYDACRKGIEMIRRTIQ